MLLMMLGATCLVVAAANAGYNPCQPGKPVSLEVTATGNVIEFCGGLDPIPFLVSGVLGAGCGLVLFRRPPRRARS
jgi:hypothetical protein